MMACEYCEESPNSFYDRNGFDLSLDHGFLYIDYRDEEVGLVHVHIPINFYPMCGEKLGGDE